MKIRTDFVTNSSSSNFTVEITINYTSGSVYIEENPYNHNPDDGGEARFDGDLREVNAKDASVKLATTKKRVEKATTGLTTSKSALENANRACEAATEKYKQRSQAIASEEQARKRAEEETKKKADEAAKRHLAEEAQRQAEENARRRDEEAKRRAEEALRIKQIQESKAKEDVKKASANSTGPASITPKKFVRPYVADAKLSDTLNRAFDRLEKLFPEGKVFSFDSLDSDLRERMAELYKKAGYKTVDDMLRTYGFEIISGDEVRKIRSFVMYTPGNEPDVIKNKVNSMISRLNEYALCISHALRSVGVPYLSAFLRLMHSLPLDDSTDSILRVFIAQGVHSDVLLEVGMNKGKVFSIFHFEALLGKK